MWYGLGERIVGFGTEMFILLNLAKKRKVGDGGKNDDDSSGDGNERKIEEKISGRKRGRR